MPSIDHHVVLLRRMTVHALRALGILFVEMMLFGVKFGGIVAACTQRITFGAQFKRMRLMAIHAGNAVPEHLALPEGTPGVILVALLPIGIIRRLREQCRVMRVFQRQAGQTAFNQRRAARMASPAGIDQFFCRRVVHDAR